MSLRKQKLTFDDIHKTKTHTTSILLNSTLSWNHFILKTYFAFRALDFDSTSKDDSFVA